MNNQSTSTYDDLRKLHMSAHLLIKLRKGIPFAEAIASDTADTDAMAIGRAAHTFILEPEVFREKYVVGGPVNPRTNKCYGRSSKKFIEWSQVPQQEGLECVTKEEYDMLRHMLFATMDNKAANHLLYAGEPEVTIRTEYCGMPSQSRLDWISTAGPDAQAIVDLKTTSDVNGFEFDIERYGYHWQMAYYRAVLKNSPPVYLIAVEKSIPSKCCVIQLHDHILDREQIENEKMLCSVREEFLFYLQEVEQEIEKCQKSDK